MLAAIWLRVKKPATVFVMAILAQVMVRLGQTHMLTSLANWGWWNTTLADAVATALMLSGVGAYLARKQNAAK